jgi:hypothetical protein
MLGVAGEVPVTAVFRAEEVLKADLDLADEELDRTFRLRPRRPVGMVGS